MDSPAVSPSHSNGSGSPSILLVDDHELVRSGLKFLIESIIPDASVLEADTGEKSIELAAQNNFDLVLMDIILPGIDGITSALRLISMSPDIKILILTGKSELVVPRAVLESGICGYVTKASAAAEISDAIQAARCGEFFLSSDLRERYDGDPLENNGEATPFDRLSNRELEVVLLLLKGYKTSDAGDSLTLNAKTVSTYKRRAFDKLSVGNTAELIKLAMEYNILGS